MEVPCHPSGAAVSRTELQPLAGDRHVAPRCLVEEQCATRPARETNVLCQDADQSRDFPAALVPVRLIADVLVRSNVEDIYEAYLDGVNKYIPKLVGLLVRFLFLGLLQRNG